MANFYWQGKFDKLLISILNYNSENKTILQIKSFIDAHCSSVFDSTNLLIYLHSNFKINGNSIPYQSIIEITYDKFFYQLKHNGLVGTFEINENSLQKICANNVFLGSEFLILDSWCVLLEDPELSYDILDNQKIWYSDIGGNQLFKSEVESFLDFIAKEYISETAELVIRKLDIRDRVHRLYATSLTIWEALCVNIQGSREYWNSPYNDEAWKSVRKVYEKLQPHIRYYISWAPLDMEQGWHCGNFLNEDIILIRIYNKVEEIASKYKNFKIQKALEEEN